MRVLTVDDHALVREGLRSILTQLGDVELAEAVDLRHALQEIERATPTLILLDYFLPDATGHEALTRILAVAPDAAVVVLTVDRGELAPELLRLGARGFIPKTCRPDVLIAALRLVIAGGVYVPPEMFSNQTITLDDRQRAVIALLAEGASNREIASGLMVSESTVRAELTQIFRVLEVDNRTQAVVEAIRRGLTGSSAK